MGEDEGQRTSEQGPQQRLRLTFAKGEPLKFISHLDLARTWERAFRRAGLPVVYSQGFSPHPRFQIAAALPVGVTGRAEYLDVWLTECMTPEEVLSRLAPALPPGLVVLSVEQVELRAPSLQAQVCAAEYRATVRGKEAVEAVRSRIEALLSTPTLPRQRHHKGKLQTYDLRPLVQSVTVEPGQAGECVLQLRLQAGGEGAGRPDEVLDALGLWLAPHTIERTKLYFEFDNWAGDGII